MTKTKKSILAAVLAVLAVGTLVFGGYYLWLTTPPPMPVNMEEGFDVLKSARYARLPDDRKLAYVEKMWRMREQMTPEDRRAMRERFESEPELGTAVRSAVEEMMVQRAREFAKADPKARQAMLDGFIQMEQMMRRNREGGSDRPRSNGGNREEWRRRFEERIETGDPQKQAYVGEFFKAMRLRRQELGLDPLPPHRPR